eukprot:7363636-Pyramimonas_sp.AAC.1
MMRPARPAYSTCSLLAGWRLLFRSRRSVDVSGIRLLCGIAGQREGERSGAEEAAGQPLALRAREEKPKWRLTATTVP